MQKLNTFRTHYSSILRLLGKMTKQFTNILQVKSLKNIILICFAIVILGGSLTHSPKSYAKPKNDKAVIYMKKVARQLMKAVKAGSKKRLENIIRRHADLKSIGQYSLGTYKTKLPRSRRTSYYRGVAKFMARYFMDQSRVYEVISAKVNSPSFKENGAVIVDTVVYLKAGAAHEVQWRLTPHKNSYKIRDIRILGLWLVPFQRDLFNNFVDEQGGNVNALVIALNHN